jgi:hypothetical protein
VPDQVVPGGAGPGRAGRCRAVPHSSGLGWGQGRELPPPVWAAADRRADADGLTSASAGGSRRRLLILDAFSGAAGWFGWCVAWSTRQVSSDDGRVHAVLFARRCKAGSDERSGLTERGAEGGRLRTSPSRPPGPWLKPARPGVTRLAISVSVGGTVHGREVTEMRPGGHHRRAHFARPDNVPRRSLGSGDSWLNPTGSQ